MSMSKDSIKKELIDKSNEILKKYDESYVVDDIAILNTAKNTSFLGNLRVFNDVNVKKIQGEIEKAFKDIGVLKVRNRKVIPCCAPYYFHISFNIAVDK